MFGLFRGARSTAARPKARVILRVLDLEARDQPDGGTGDPPTQPAGQSLANSPPVIVDFDAEQVGNGAYLLTGWVLDENPAGLIVTFGGSTSAAGITVTCDAEGYFSIIVELRTDGSDTGYITATTIDDLGQESEEVQVYVDP
jgi:hypothetical protein